MDLINTLGRKKGLAAAVRLLLTLLFVCPMIVLSGTVVQAGVWDMDPPPLKDEPQWKHIQVLWADHYRGKNLDELISILNTIKDNNPDAIEPYLWLARLHHLHARYHSRQRAYHFDKAETYAAQACNMDQTNSLAVRSLVDTLFHCRNREYIFKNYGGLIRSFAPLPREDALPDMATLEGWDDFKQLWDERADFEKAKAAAALMDKTALARPTDAMVQIWASRVNNYIGEYHLSLGQYSKGVPFYKKGITFAEKALELQPDSIPANYWLEFNITRTIQNKWLFQKARYLMTLLTPTLFCAREDSLYYFAGPMLSLGVMISNGGWVTEKGMALAGVDTDLDLNALELAGILHPDYLFIPYQRADILAYKGNTKEALAILAEMLSRNPEADKQIPENLIYHRLAKALYTDLQKGYR